MIASDDLVPDELTALLGNTPKLGVKKGETFRASNGEIEARTGQWSLAVIGATLTISTNKSPSCCRLCPATPTFGSD
jgi:hypothetical protein